MNTYEKKLQYRYYKMYSIYTPEIVVSESDEQFSIDSKSRVIVILTLQLSFLIILSFLHQISFLFHLFYLQIHVHEIYNIRASAWSILYNPTILALRTNNLVVSASFVHVTAIVQSIIK